MAASLAAETDLNLLPHVYEVMKSIDKDTNDVVTQKMIDLQVHFQKARECIDRLPGTQYSQEEQLRLKSILHQQLEIKTQLLLNYKSGNTFDVHFSSKSNSATPSNSNTPN